ncbi:MAG: S41 family peptidase [Clostridia bacterium]|nr:S41 family peptidase [Clostridia bacterium]
MNKNSLIRTILIAALTAAVTWLITYTATMKGAERDVSSLLGGVDKYEKLEEIQQYVDKYFVGEYDEEKVMNAAAEGYVAGLGDKWSYYMDPESYASFTDDRSGNYTGVGVTVHYLEEEEALQVLDVNDGSAASEVGVRPLDLIVAVEGQPIAELGFEGAVSAIKGEEGTSVTLTLIRGEVRFDVSVERRKIDKQYVYSDLLDGNVGYIRITEFSIGAQDGFLNAVDALLSRGAESFVFDVRNNPGGDLNVLINILNRILGNKDLFIEEYQNGERYTFTSDEVSLDCPIAVLCNSNSYSAAEYFAAVLQEYGVATVVGEATTGKGYGQTTFELKDGSAMVLSIIRYYTPEGRSLKESGVTPDVEVALDEANRSLIGRMDAAADSQLAEALKAVGK